MQMFYYKNQNRKNSISQNPVFIGSNAGQNTDETMVSLSGGTNENKRTNSRRN